MARGNPCRYCRIWVPSVRLVVLFGCIPDGGGWWWVGKLQSGRNRIHVLTPAAASLQGQYENNTTLVMAASVAAMLPLIVMFVIFQRQIVRSIRITSFR